MNLDIAIFGLMYIIDKITDIIGKGVSWLSLLLVLIIVVDVFLRYAFALTSALSFELEWHVFAVIFMLGAAYALKQDRHVRVDVFYTRFGKKTKAWVNLIGVIVFLLPFTFIVFWESLDFVANSFAVRETSPDPGGLPARYLIKSAIPMGFLLLGLQGISVGMKSLKTILR